MIRRFKRAALAALFSFSMLASMFAPAMATDRVQFLFGMNPPSSWHNFIQRYNRVGYGTLLWNLFGGATGGSYANLSIVATTGLTIAVQPSVTNTVGTVYQFLPEESNPFGGPGTTALPADPTQVFLQGQVAAGTQAPLTGATLTPPGTAGQSINYLIECQVQTVDATSQTVTFVTPQNQQTTGAANRDRKDIGGCQSKAGTAATTGSQVTPAVDAGWVGIGFVPVANGATSISGITMLTASKFNGFIAATSTGLPSWSGALPVVQGGSGSTTLAGSPFVVLSPSSQQTGSINVSGTISAGGVVNYGAAGIGSLPNGNAIGGGANLNLNTATGSNISFGSGASQALLLGTISAAGAQAAPTINSVNTLGFLPPVYTTGGAAFGTSSHIVTGQISAVSTSTTITLSGAAVFGGNNYVISVTDASASAANPAVSIISNSSFLFASTSGHVYNFFVFGQ
jgi:hypothetical protein